MPAMSSTSQYLNTTPDEEITTSDNSSVRKFSRLGQAKHGLHEDAESTLSSDM